MAERKNEQGTALIIALLVMVIMTLLGIPFLMMGETENRIAENERLALQAQYAAEAGARMVRRWFDQPTSPLNAVAPDLNAIDRTLRLIDDDTDPNTDPVAADGTPGLPYYKWDDDTVFQQPYRGSLDDTLVGTEDGPDMRIAREDSAAAEAFLDGLSQALLQGYADSGGTEARITQIDVYAPPLAQRAGDWVRLGVGTVKVEAGIYLPLPGGGTQTLAEQTVRFVFNEIPYQNEKLGAIHTCGDLDYPENFRPRWGTATSEHDFIVNSHRRIPAGIPRLESVSLVVDDLWPGDLGVLTDAKFDEYYLSAAVDGEFVEDPWLRIIAGGNFSEAPNNDTQPWPFEAPGSWSAPPADLEFTYHVGSSDYFGNPGDAAAECPNPECDGTHSSVVQNVTDIGCPDLPYDVWKAIALRGGPTIRYFAWDGDAGKFFENGSGVGRSFADWTNGETGFFFFDTADGLSPAADGSNLTPNVSIDDTVWHVTGVVYLNAAVFHVNNTTGNVIDFVPPGEPFLDIDPRNGQYDVGERYVNLAYPTALNTLAGVPKIDWTDDWNENGPPVIKRNARGPAISSQANVYGILFNSGRIDSNGDGKYYGSLISGSGIAPISTSSDGPRAYWDASMRYGEWPPPAWGLPRIVVTRWETGT